MYYRLYQILSWLFFIVSFPPLFIYSLLTGYYRLGLGQRFGALPGGPSGPQGTMRVWLHGASVGEVQAARALLAELQVMLPGAVFFLSTMTEQGLQVARKQLGATVHCMYAPFDLPGIVGRAVNELRPDVYICLETELWPNLIRQLDASGVTLFLLNGRLSERSFERYRLVRSLMRDVLARFTVISVIHRADRERFLALGADPARVVVSGNAKYDLGATGSRAAVEAGCRKWLGDGEERPLLVTGSTHAGEEEMLVGVVDALKRHERLRGLIWVVAPRHLQRLGDIEEMLAAHGVIWDRLSTVMKRGLRAEVLLVDVWGELAALYSVATFVFCGGSFVPCGGHNIMEAAVHGKPVFYGPSMKDFDDAVQLLEAAQAGFMVADPRALTEAIIYYAEHPAEYRAAGLRAREVALAQQGSAAKQARLVVESMACGSSRCRGSA